MDALLAGADRADLDRDSEIIVGIIPSIVEKVVIPFLIGKCHCFNNVFKYKT